MKKAKTQFLETFLQRQSQKRAKNKACSVPLSCSNDRWARSKTRVPWEKLALYFLQPFIYDAFVFRKLLCPSFVTNVWRFLHQKKRNFISFPTVPTLFGPSGFIQLQSSFFWCHSNMDMSRIHEKCANCPFLHNNLCQKFRQTAVLPLFYGANFTNAL